MGRRRWADDLEPSLAGRGRLTHARREAGESRAPEHVPPATASLLSLQRSAGNQAIATALRTAMGGGRRPVIVAQREKPGKQGTKGQKGKQTPKPTPPWLKDAQGILAEMAKSDPLLGNVTLKNYVDLNAALRSFGYGAWTQSKTEIYVKNMYPKGTSRKDPSTRRQIEQYVRYGLQHEAEHVHQFDRDGGPPKTWQRMLEYEQEAYSKDVKWLDGPGKTIVTETDVMTSIKQQVTKNLKDVTDLLDGIAKLPPKTDVEKHLHKEMITRRLIPSKAGLNPQDLYKQP